MRPLGLSLRGRMFIAIIFGFVCLGWIVTEAEKRKRSRLLWGVLAVLAYISGIILSAVLIRISGATAWGPEGDGKMARLVGFVYGLLVLTGFQLGVAFVFVKLVSLGFMKHPVVECDEEARNKKLQPTADVPVE